MVQILDLENLKKGIFRDQKTVVIIGFFDGVHVGHRKIISLCVKRAREIGGTSLVFTFDRPPLNIIKRGLYKKLITSLQDKLKLIEDMGVDYIIVAKFEEDFSKLSPEKFCQEILLEKLSPREIFVGEGFRFGKDAKGDNNFLKNFLQSYGVRVNTIPLYKVNGIPVSSTVIREYFLKGDIEKVKELLGRFPQLSGTVVRASGRGKKLGFPTANIDVCDRFVIPKDGVYAGVVGISGQKEKLPSLINVGDNPTFKESKKWVEVYILNFDQDIYGKEINIYFLRKLRDEMVFEDENKLAEQIKIDLENAKKYFESKYKECQML